MPPVTNQTDDFEKRLNGIEDEIKSLNLTLATLIDYVLPGDNKPTDMTDLFHAKTSLLKRAGIDPTTGNPL